MTNLEEYRFIVAGIIPAPVLAPASVGADVDGDGYPDAWEDKYSFNPNLPGHGLDDDPDADGLVNGVEADLDTNPFLLDTDGDGLPDGWEWGHNINPNSGEGVDGANGDANSNRISNWEEYQANPGDLGSNPNVTDSDGDGLTDKEEMDLGTNPTNPDTDGDGWSDSQEVAYGTNPVLADLDTDQDGYRDIWESMTGMAAFGWDPLVANTIGNFATNADPDADGLTNLQEQVHFTHPNKADTDGDTLKDGWEVAYAAQGFNPLVVEGEANLLPGADPDDDGLTNAQESTARTNPFNADTDGDTYPDAWEVLWGLDPTTPATGDLLPTADKDGDGLTNAQELDGKTNPLNVDTDGDTLKDGWEVTYRSRGFNPLVVDTQPDLLPSDDPDHDGLTNAQESTARTNPFNDDTDGDTYPDAWEVKWGWDPITPAIGVLLPDADEDGDGLTNAEELVALTNPSDPDTDGDTLNDGWEIQYASIGFNPLIVETQLSLLPGTDTDSDGLSNAEEADAGTNPAVADTDGDTLSDSDELGFGTDPTKADTDGDGMGDAWERNYGFNPLAVETGDKAPGSDPDADGLTNAQEAQYKYPTQTEQGLNPFKDDTDSDGLTDKTEIDTVRTDPNNSDTDADQLPDGWEWTYTTEFDPIVAETSTNNTMWNQDWDADGLSNLDEYTYRTNPLEPDTDADGVSDGDEVKYGTNPLLAGDLVSIVPTPTTAVVDSIEGEPATITLQVRINGEPKVEAGWTASVVEGAGGFLSLQGATVDGPLAGTTGDGGYSELRVNYEPNLAPTLRTNHILVQLDQGSSVTIVVEQSGNPGPRLTVDKTNIPIPADGGTASFKVSNTGGGELDWAASLLESNGFVAFAADSTGSLVENANKTVRINCPANLTTQERVNTIEIEGLDHSTSGEVFGSPATITVTQAAGVLPGAPLNFKASVNALTGAVVLSWTAADGAIGYDVYRGTSAVQSAAVLLGSANSDAVSFTDATPLGLATAAEKAGCFSKNNPTTVQVFYWISTRNGIGASGAAGPVNALVTTSSTSKSLAASSVSLPSSYGGNAALIVLVIMVLAATRRRGNAVR